MPCSAYILSHLIIFSVYEGQFKLELCGVNAKNPGTTLSIQTVDTVSLDPGHIDRQVQGTDYTIVTENIKTLDSGYCFP